MKLYKIRKTRNSVIFIYVKILINFNINPDLLQQLSNINKYLIHIK